MMRYHQRLLGIEARINTMLLSDAGGMWPVLDVKLDPGCRIIEEQKLQGSVIWRNVVVTRGRDDKSGSYDMFIPEAVFRADTTHAIKNEGLREMIPDTFSKLYILNVSDDSPVLRLDVKSTTWYVESNQLLDIQHSIRTTSKGVLSTERIIWKNMRDLLLEKTTFSSLDGETISVWFEGDILTFVFKGLERSNSFTAHFFEVKFKIPTMTQTAFQEMVRGNQGQ